MIFFKVWPHNLEQSNFTAFNFETVFGILGHEL